MQTSYFLCIAINGWMLREIWMSANCKKSFILLFGPFKWWCHWRLKGFFFVIQHLKKSLWVFIWNFREWNNNCNYVSCTLLIIPQSSGTSCSQSKVQAPKLSLVQGLPSNHESVFQILDSSVSHRKREYLSDTQIKIKFEDFWDQTFEKLSLFVSIFRILWPTKFRNHVIWVSLHSKTWP